MPRPRLRDRFAQQGPTLGICLGMQLALEASEEDGGVEGLGLLGGEVGPPHDGARSAPRLGHRRAVGRSLLLRPLLRRPSPRDSIATSDGITVAVQRGPFLGVQFHPEKSGEAGLEFLEQCLSPV